MTTAQRSLFDEDPSRPATRSLAVRAPSARPLSKTEKAFNRLLGRVQALQRRLEEERRRLDEALVFHAAEVRPRIERAVGLRKDLVRALAPFLDDRRLKPADGRVLSTIVAEQLNDVLMNDGTPDEDLRELFGRLHGVGYADAAQEEIEEARFAMEAMLAELGLEVQLPELRADMSEEELAATTAEMMDRLRQSTDSQAREPQRPRRRKRESREEARLRRLEEMRKSGLTAVYRRLVKALHPDLERDAGERARKIAMMQEVTAAYGRNDLHTLLRLELEWIDQERSEDAERLSNETLEAYTECLKEQAKQLEAERVELRYEPRYAPLMGQQGPFGLPLPIDGPSEVRRLDMVIDTLRAALGRMTGDQAWHELRDTIRVYRKRRGSARRS